MYLHIVPTFSTINNIVEEYLNKAGQNHKKFQFCGFSEIVRLAIGVIHKPRSHFFQNFDPYPPQVDKRGFFTNPTLKLRGILATYNPPTPKKKTI